MKIESVVQIKGIIIIYFCNNDFKDFYNIKVVV